MSYDALLLDYDGVVVEVVEDEQRRPAFRSEIERRLRTDGLDAPDDIVEAFAYSVGHDDLRDASERTGIAPERLWRYRDDAIAEVLTTAAREGQKRPYDDVRALAAVDVPMGVASNNQQRVVEAITEEHGLSEHFETIHARRPEPASLRRKKPNPLFVERAWADLDADDPLYVGDRGKDVVAGQRAGMDTALLRREHNRGRSFDAEPTYEVDSLEAITDIVSSR